MLMFWNVDITFAVIIELQENSPAPESTAEKKQVRSIHLLVIQNIVILTYFFFDRIDSTSRMGTS